MIHQGLVWCSVYQNDVMSTADKWPLPASVLLLRVAFWPFFGAHSSRITLQVWKVSSHAISNLWRPRQVINCYHVSFLGHSLHVFWVVVSNVFDFNPYLGKIPILTNIFQRGWNHQLVLYMRHMCERERERESILEPHGIRMVTIRAAHFHCKAWGHLSGAKL